MANPSVKVLKPKQLAAFIGQKIVPQGSPTVSVSKAPNDPNDPSLKLYELVITYKIAVHDEHTGASGTKPLPPGTFAVLNQGKNQTVLGSPENKIVFSSIQNGAADDFTIEIELTGTLPGSKGNHAS